MSTLIMFNDTTQLIHLLNIEIFPELFKKYPKLTEISLAKRLTKYFETDNISGDILLSMGVKRLQEDVLQNANHDHISKDIGIDSFIELFEHHALFYGSDIKHKKEQFEAVFDELIQNKPLFITELIEVYSNPTEDTTSLSQGLTQHLQCDPNQKREMCDLMLHHYIKKHEVRTCNFLKILGKTIIDLFPNTNCNEYLKIAEQHQLDGNIFVTGAQSMSSPKFAKLFSGIKGYNRRRLINVFVTIKRWKPFQIEKDHIQSLYDMIHKCALERWESRISKHGKEECTYNAAQSYHCRALNRLCFVSKHFEQLTQRAKRTDTEYIYDMKDFVLALPNYDPIQLLNDINHITQHESNGNIRQCDASMSGSKFATMALPKYESNGKDCIHFQRSLRDRNAQQCRDLGSKQQLFNSRNPQDFLYVSMLDKAHCLIYHYNKMIRSDDNNAYVHSVMQQLTHDVQKAILPIHDVELIMKRLYKQSVHNLTRTQLRNLFKTESAISDYNNMKIDLKNRRIGGSNVLSFEREMRSPDNASCGPLKQVMDENSAVFSVLKHYNESKWQDLRRGDETKCSLNTDEKREEDSQDDEKCITMDRVKFVLSHFAQITDTLSECGGKYPYKINQFMLFLPGDLRNQTIAYKPLELSKDMEHIMEHPTKNKDSRCVQDCIHYTRCMDKRDMPSSRNRKTLFNTDNAYDFDYIAMFDTAHCLIYHPNDIDCDDMYNEFKKHVQSVMYPIFSTGQFIDYVSLKPLYPNLKEEITKNKLCTIAEHLFSSTVQDAVLKEKTMSIDIRASKTDKRFGIFKNDKIHIQHLLAILLYCDNSRLCESFRESFRKMHYDDTTEIIIQRHIDNYYWFGRFLFAAIEFWGAAPRITDTKKFYHGTSCKFLFDTFSAVFETPTSTTWDKIIASNFCKGSGVVLELAPKFKGDLNPSKFLNVSNISHFSNEKERLFAGMTVLAIVNIHYKVRQKTKNKSMVNVWQECSEYMKSMLYFERIIEQNIHNKDFYNYGVITAETIEEWVDRQRIYLVPLIQAKVTNTQKKISQYIFDLFVHFCDKQTTFIDLSCIQYERQFM
eukprot:247318_1